MTQEDEERAELAAVWAALGPVASAISDLDPMIAGRMVGDLKSIHRDWRGYPSASAALAQLADHTRHHLIAAGISEADAAICGPRIGSS